MKHKQVKIQHPRKGLIEVDEGIAPLLKAMWKLSINTVMSCQRVSPKGMWPHVWIEFTDETAMARFIEVVADNVINNPKRSPSRRIYTCMTTPYQYADSWQFRIYPLDFSVPDEQFGMIDTNPTGDAAIMFSYHVDFPCKHYPAVLAAVQKAARAGVPLPNQ